MKYVIYLRVSTGIQDDRTQLEKCLQFIKTQHAGEFKYLVFSDKLSSRKVYEKRQGLQAALRALHRGDMLIAMRLDRLARNLHETTTIVKDLELRGAEVMMVEQPGIKNKIMLGLYAGLAEEEVKLIRARITEKLDIKRTRGERVSRYIPYGYQLDYDHPIWITRKDRAPELKPGLLLEEPAEQHQLILMQVYFDQGMSYQQIAEALTAAGLRTRQGKGWLKASIHRILCRTGRSRPAAEYQPEQGELLSHG